LSKPPTVAQPLRRKKKKDNQTTWIQRQATISITGAMRTSPGDATIVHANLTPIAIHLKETGTKAILWLALWPDSHLIAKYIRKAHRCQTKRHKTALHHLAGHSTFDPTRTEKVALQRHHPGTTPNFTTNISCSKEQVIKWDREHFNKGIMIYTDGSGYLEMTGALTILYISGINKAELCYQLGTMKQHTVFKGKPVAILLGLHLAKGHLGIHHTLNISINRQP
jgi:hypothetical protein